VFIVQAPFVIVYWLAFVFVQRTHPEGAQAQLQTAAGVGGDLDSQLSGEPGEDSIVVKMRQVDAPSFPITTADRNRGSRSNSRSRAGSVAAPPSGTSPSQQALLSTGRSSSSTAATLADSPPDLYNEQQTSPDARVRGSTGLGPRADSTLFSVEGSPDDGEGPGAFGTYETLEQQEFYAAEPQWNRFLRVSRSIASPAIQLGLVYVFEYVVSVALAAKANPRGGGQTPTIHDGAARGIRAYAARLVHA